MNCQLSIGEMIKTDYRSASGMTVLELLLATTMLIVFTGVVAAVMEFTLRFMSESECPVDSSGVSRCNDQATGDVANGVLIDRQRIEFLFDELEHVLVQPGIPRARIETISAVLGSPPGEVCTPESSTSNWTSNDKIPELPVLNFPRGYHICLWKVGIHEASIEELIDTTNGSATPGLYVLQALPSKLNASTIPVRRLLCRPRPFC